MLPVSLDCQLFIAPLVFSNVYLHYKHDKPINFIQCPFEVVLHYPSELVNILMRALYGCSNVCIVLSFVYVSIFVRLQYFIHIK